MGVGACEPTAPPEESLLRAGQGERSGAETGPSIPFWPKRVCTGLSITCSGRSLGLEMAFHKGQDGRHQCTGVHERTGARPQQPLDSCYKKKLGDRLSTSGDVGRKRHMLLLHWPAAPLSRAVPPSFRVHSPSRPACQLDSLLSFQAGTLFHILANCVQVERIWWKKPHVHMRACVRVSTL